MSEGQFREDWMWMHGHGKKAAHCVSVYVTMADWLPTPTLCGEDMKPVLRGETKRKRFFRCKACVTKLEDLLPSRKPRSEASGNPVTE